MTNNNNSSHKTHYKQANKENFTEACNVKIKDVVVLTDDTQRNAML